MSMRDASGQIVIVNNVARILCNKCGYRDFKFASRCFECANPFSEELIEKREDLNEVFIKYVR